MSNKDQKIIFMGLITWISNLYRNPYFWLQLIPSLIILLLVMSCLYTAYYYFKEPMSSFDPERLGQLGDFLGGSLNPIFGSITVFLLLWSIFIQRRELSLTKEELKKSAEALNGQLKQIESDSARKQLTDILNYEYINHEKILNQTFKFIDDKEEISYRKIFGCSNIKEIINADLSDEKLNLITQSSDNFYQPKENISKDDENILAAIIVIIRTRESINSIESVTKEMLSVCNIESVESYWFMKFYDAMDDCKKAGVVSKRTFEVKIDELQTHRKIHINKKNQGNLP